MVELKLKLKKINSYSPPNSHDLKIRLIADAQKIREVNFKEDFVLESKLLEVASYIFDLEKRLE